jgi:hypothetical protein
MVASRGFTWHVDVTIGSIHSACHAGKIPTPPASRSLCKPHRAETRTNWLTSLQSLLLRLTTSFRRITPPRWCIAEALCMSNAMRHETPSMPNARMKGVR